MWDLQVFIFLYINSLLALLSLCIFSLISLKCLELSYYCACALIRKSLQDIRTDPAILTIVVEEILNCIKKMYPPHIQAFCLCIRDHSFETNDTRYACVPFISLRCLKSNTSLEKNEQDTILSSIYNYFHLMKNDDINTKLSNQHKPNPSTSTSFTNQDIANMIHFLETECYIWN